MRRLDGKVAIITGGAGGIGRAAGALFVGEGASVLLVDRPGSGVEGAAREIGGAVAAFAADVTDSLQVDAYMREALDRFGGVDIALLNAGIEGAHTPLEEYPPEVFAQGHERSTSAACGSDCEPPSNRCGDEAAVPSSSPHRSRDHRRSPTRPPTPRPNTP